MVGSKVCLSRPHDAYELDAFKLNLTRTEADIRIAMLTAKLKLLGEPPHTLWTGTRPLSLPPNLSAPGAAEGLCCLSGGYESGVSILRRHRRGRLDIRQAASRGSGEYRRGAGLIIRELANNQPVMVAEGQVPPDELASDTLEEFGNGLLTIFRVSTIPLTASEVKRPREM